MHFFSDQIRSDNFAKTREWSFLCSKKENSITLSIWHWNKAKKKCFALKFIWDAYRCRVDFNWLHSDASEVNAKLDYSWKTLFKIMYYCSAHVLIKPKKHSVCCSSSNTFATLSNSIHNFSRSFVRSFRLFVCFFRSFFQNTDPIRQCDIFISLPKYFSFYKMFANKAKTRKWSIKMLCKLREIRIKCLQKIIAQFVFTRSDFVGVVLPLIARASDGTMDPLKLLCDDKSYEFYIKNDLLRRFCVMCCCAFGSLQFAKINLLKQKRGKFCWNSLIECIHSRHLF